MGFGARTIHSTFVIEVGKIGQTLTNQVKKMSKFVKNNPKTTFLIVFDECSMMASDIISSVFTRLEEAKIDINRVGFIFFGDPAQCEPIGGKSMWTTDIEIKEPKSNAKKIGNYSKLDGPTAFRHVMGMKPLDEIPCMKNKNRIAKLRKKEILTQKEIEEIKSFDQELGQLAYDGKYEAIYLDEVQRTDGSKESLDYVELMTKVRYGKYTSADMQTLREVTASEEDYKNDDMFAGATHLTAYHFYEEGQGDRTTADSANAKSLVQEAERQK